MQHHVCGPPSLIIPRDVLPKTAGVENAEMRIDARPGIRRRLTAIIKTRPHEAAAQPWARGKDAIPLFGGVRPTGRVHVVGADVAAHLVVLVNAARADGAALLR